MEEINITNLEMSAGYITEPVHLILPAKCLTWYYFGNQLQNLNLRFELNKQL